MSVFEPLEITQDGRRISGRPEAKHQRMLPFIVKEACERTGCNEFVEVGSWAGNSALKILEAECNQNVRLYCVDWWRGSESDVTGVIAEELGERNIFRTFCRNVKDLLFTRLFPCVGTSETFAAIWPRQVAGVYIDADHSYDGCLQDLKLWWPHILPGGVLCGHDYRMFQDVADAVRDFRLSQSLPKEKDDLEMWWIEKPCENP